MAYRRLPNSTPSVLRTLNKMRDTYLLTPAAERAITAAQFAQLDASVPTSFLNRFRKEVSDVDTAQAAQGPLTTALTRAAAKLTMYVSHFHQVFDLGVARGNFQAAARSHYGRDISSNAIPDLSTYQALEEAAQKVMSGEAARQTAEASAYLPMSLPSAADISGVYSGFRNLHEASQRAQGNTNREQEEASALYPEAQALAVDLCDTVEFFHRKDPSASSRRAKCIRWGVVYIYEAGETPDEGAGAGSGGTTPSNP